MTPTPHWDAENRLMAVTGNGQNVQNIYDGDGHQVKKVENGVATVYVGNHTEVKEASRSVAWLSQVNTAAVGSTLQKTGSASAWDAGAVSSQALTSGDGYVEAVATSATDVMFGLSCSRPVYLVAIRAFSA